MKKIFILIFFYTVTLKAQIFKGVLLDSITKAPLEMANICFVSTNFGVFTDGNGKFKIDVSGNRDEIRITNIGYNSKIVKIKNNRSKEIDTIIYLNPKIEILNEISILRKKIKYGWQKSIISEQQKTQYLGFQFGTENCRFIENTYKKRGKISDISIYLKKIKDHKKPCKLCKVDYITSYNIKFYSYDSINNKPGDEIFDKNIIIEPENRTYKLTINLDSLKIPLPKNGVCVGIETINIKYKQPKRAGAYIAPGIKFTEVSEKLDFKSWIRYRSEGWVFKSLGTRDKKGKRYKDNMLIIDLGVKIEK